MRLNVRKSDEMKKGVSPPELGKLIAETAGKAIFLHFYFLLCLNRYIKLKVNETHYQ